MGKESENERVTAEHLLRLMGDSPADNSEGYRTAVHFRSQMVGDQVKALMGWKNAMDAVSREPLVFGPLAFWAGLQSTWMKVFLTDPIREQAEEMVRNGESPDVFTLANEKIESEYARRLYELCGAFIRDDVFDVERAREVSGSAEGKEFLEARVLELSRLERSYNSQGMTRLMALKELLKALLIVITETPVEGTLPYIHKDSKGEPIGFSDYLEENRIRFQNLYRGNAFHLKGFSQRVTGGRIGYSHYEVVEGSELHCVRLRYYPLPQGEGYRPNGKILYMSSPLINKPEIYDLAENKSVIVGMHRQGYQIYLVDNGDPGPDETDLGLDFFCKTVNDSYLDLIRQRHPSQEIYVMAYCMAGTLIIPYLARRVEERIARGEPVDIKKVVMMASPVKFDDDKSGHAAMRKVIREQYEPELMKELFGRVNIPSQVIEAGMQDIQPGVQYTVASGFYGRALFPGAIEDAAPFVYWLHHGTKFPARAHREWLYQFFIGDSLYSHAFRLSSTVPELDGKPVDLNVLGEAGVAILDYRGQRDPIAPAGSCIASELWGKKPTSRMVTSVGGLNRTIEKNIGHIFVVSKKLLAEFLEIVAAFYEDRTSVSAPPAS